MNKYKVLFGTSNPTKLSRIRSIVSDLPIEVVSPDELGVDIEVTESGSTAVETHC